MKKATTKYRYKAYSTPSATWTLDTADGVITLFWNQNKNKIKYRQGNKHYAEHKARILARTA